jgi:hypothetical protein
MTAQQLKTARPQWAKKMPAKLWRDLHNCQGKTPTLTRLKLDLAHQEEIKGWCQVCRDAARIAGLL